MSNRNEQDLLKKETSLSYFPQEQNKENKEEKKIENSYLKIAANSQK